MARATAGNGARPPTRTTHVFSSRSLHHRPTASTPAALVFDGGGGSDALCRISFSGGSRTFLSGGAGGGDGG